MKLSLLVLAGAVLLPPAQDTSPFDHALRSAASALERDETTRARPWIQRALERDPRSLEAWDLRAQWAAAAEDDDELVYALHRMLALTIAQGASKTEIRTLRDRLDEADPIAADLFAMKESFLGDLLDIAGVYEKERRPHSAIAAYREALSLDPENALAQEAIDRIASQPDPSLAEDSKGPDLFGDVTDEWIRKHDKKHSEWGKKASLKSEYYNVKTNAGYRILIQSAHAMDKMHVFYKRFFGVDSSVARIDLNIFKNRDEYLKLGQSPAEWSGGQFTGGAVETYVGGGGFQSTLNTLFHEAAHQFVNRATSAGGWLNEGLASFFEGSELLANGTVRMNAPATHRLAPLAQRLEAGWMSDYKDGTDRADPQQVPRTAPGFDIILENKYEWGPAWYAPTWGVVYFCYNYQDPTDGRFVYREAFLEFIDKSGGRAGDSAIGNFEDVVLGNPAEPTKGVESEVALPRTMAELNPLWKEWILRLRDEINGTVRVDRPYLAWARHAVTRGDFDDALEHFEQGLLATPRDPEFLLEFAEFLASERKEEDRAVKLALETLAILESPEDGVEPDKKRIANVEKRLRRWDPTRKTLDRLHQDVWATSQSLVRRYLTAERHLMTMDLAWRLTTDLNVPDLMSLYEEAWRRSRKSLHLWKLAYNERDLDGWSAGPDTPFVPSGEILDAKHGRYTPGDYAYSTLPMDIVTSGDYSFEVDVQASSGRIGFCGIVFGMRGPTTFNALIYLPGKGQTGVVSGSGYLDLSGFRGAGGPVVWRHVPVPVPRVVEGSSSADGEWKRLRMDVTGPFVDVYLDGELKVTHEFPSSRMAAGSLGLVVSRGTARFRNVRYLERRARDPGARLERAVKMEEFGDEETSIGGSWLGKVPPFPDVERWASEPRKSWREAGPVPQIFALWSTRQNDLIPIHDWLAWLEEHYSDVGLRIVCVDSIEDREVFDGYLDRRPFPGSVALDRTGVGLGETFDDYAIELFNLPRVILLDIDGRVVWEGDPGFRAGSRWTPGTPTFLDAPLEELIDRRKLRELSSWRDEWSNVAVPAMHEADLARARPVLEAAARFEAKGDSDVFDAQSRLSAVQSTLEALDVTIASFERDGCAPALAVLLDWATAIGFDIDRRTSKSVKALARGPAAVDWEDLLGHLKSHPRRVKRDGEEVALRELMNHLEKREGRFPAFLLEQLEETASYDEVDSVIRAANRIPELWLARGYFNW